MAFIKLYREKDLPSLYAPDDHIAWIRDDDVAAHDNLRLVTYSAIIAMIGIFISAFTFFPDVTYSLIRKFNESWPIYAIPISMLAYIAVHELVHALFMPKSKAGKGQTYFIVSNGMPAVFYNGEMSINRFVIVALSPLVVISAVLLSLNAIYDDVLIQFLLLNHFAACAFDLKAAIRMWKKKKNYEKFYSSRIGILFK